MFYEEYGFIYDFGCIIRKPNAKIMPTIDAPTSSIGSGFKWVSQSTTRLPMRATVPSSNAEGDSPQQHRHFLMPSFQSPVHIGRCTGQYQ